MKKSGKGTAEKCADASRDGNESFGWDTKWNSHEMRRKRYAKNRWNRNGLDLQRAANMQAEPI